jgi:hypothetical protein
MTMRIDSRTEAETCEIFVDDLWPEIWDSLERKYNRPISERELINHIRHYYTNYHDLLADLMIHRGSEAHRILKGRVNQIISEQLIELGVILPPPPPRCQLTMHRSSGARS